MPDFILPFILSFIVIFIMVKLFWNYQFNEAKTTIDFECSVNFGLYRHSKVRNFINNSLSTHRYYRIGNEKFDSEVFVSSDYEDFVRLLKRLQVAQDLIIKILSDDFVHGIVCENNKLSIKIKNKKRFNDKKNESLEYISFRVLPLLTSLKNEIQQPITELIKKELSITKEELIKSESFIIKTEQVYVAFLAAAIFQFFYNVIINARYVIMIDNINVLSYIYCGLIFSVIIIFYIWIRLYKSIRVHLLYTKSLLMLLPACMFSCYQILYASNYLLAYTDSIKENVSHYVTERRSSKSQVFYYNTYLKNSDKAVDVKIKRDQYRVLRQYKESEITYQKGWLGYYYIKSIAPIIEK